MSTVLIVGIGNSLLQDDGVGVHAARLLKTDPPPGADVARSAREMVARLQPSHLAHRGCQRKAQRLFTSNGGGNKNDH
jgi:hypothetical protein